MDYLNELVHKNDIQLRKSFIEGVRSELIFYHVYREELSLQPTPWDIDKYLHIDFSGKHPKTGKRILLDVTKNPKIKLEKADNVEKWRKVYQKLKLLGSDAEYLIATYDPDENDLNLGPLLLPVHKNGYLGFYIAKLESEPIEDSFLSRLAVTIGVIYVVAKHWYRDGKPSIYYEAIDYETLHGDLFEPYRPPSFELMYDVYSYSYLEDVVERTPGEEGIPTFEEFVYNERADLAYYYRKTLGITITATFEEDYIIVDPRDASGYWGYITTWIHPVINKVFGTKIGKIFDEPAIASLDDMIRGW